ncbi:MAG TPA: hypothetical protein VFR36_01985 [Sphingomicrobium sp.]|nr:hypothetical protein [Sphingomicrobium sp.]
MLRTEGAVRRSAAWRELPPSLVGLAAALRRAYSLPDEKGGQRFEELLRKLD